MPAREVVSAQKVIYIYLWDLGDQGAISAATSLLR